MQELGSLSTILIILLCVEAVLVQATCLTYQVGGAASSHACAEQPAVLAHLGTGFGSSPALDTPAGVPGGVHAAAPAPRLGPPLHAACPRSAS